MTRLGGSVVAGGLLLVGQLFVVGWVAAMFVSSLGHYFSVEEFEAIQQTRNHGADGH